MDENLLKKRLTELNDRAYTHSYAVFSDFLNMEEQSVLANLYLPCVKFGGYSSAERVVAGFGEYVSEQDFPIVCVRISPASKKFADKLTHRDFLGALMTLGVKREMIGDIAVVDNCGYVFCLSQIADYLAENVVRIKHTTVSATITQDIPDTVNRTPESAEYIVSSCRLDALVSAVYKLSRSESSKLFSQGKIFVNSKLTENTSYIAKENDIISVRGFGRFVYISTLRRTKKDRLIVELAKY